MKTVLVTGASTGLGLALARRLLDGDHRLILTARGESIERFADAQIEEGERVHLRRLDVTSAAERHAVIEEADDRWGGVDVLVNNAGVMYRAVLEHVSDDDRVAQMDVNYLAPMDLIRLVLPRMRARREGRIINVSSVGGMMAMPTMAAYSASKFALEGATESLFYEVRPWNIKVSLVQPGFIHSEAYANVRFTAESSHARDDVHAAYHAHYEHMAPFIARLMRWSRATPEKVARTITRIMKKRRPPLRVPATFDAHLFAWFRRWMPRSLYHWVLYRMLPDVRRWGHDDDGVPLALPEPRTAQRDRAP
ncbi:MAG TPA: SDR family NAD(P)-dependent oxidoreductase [Kofleriaceae bacterium]|nr:SDR family NAD(P)-dependent oxidoreductase [Kofleriaceae bacterium]